MRLSAVLQDVFCWMLCSFTASVHQSSLSQWGFQQSCRMCSAECSAVSLLLSTSPPLANEAFSSPAGCVAECSAVSLPLSTSPPSANEAFSSPAGCVLLNALQFHCLCPPVLPQPMRLSAVLQDVFCWMLCSFTASVHQSSLSQWGFQQSCRMCFAECSAVSLPLSTSPPSANEAFSSPAGCVLLNALQFHCFCLPVLH